MQFIVLHLSRCKSHERLELKCLVKIQFISTFAESVAEDKSNVESKWNSVRFISARTETDQNRIQSNRVKSNEINQIEFLSTLAESVAESQSNVESK